jgi:chromosome segregation ATPase
MSMEDEAKIAALTVASEELARKLREQEDLLSRRMAEHESELEELTGRLEETKADLMASRKEEKELRAKERAALGQIHALESEVQRLQRQVEAGRASYEGLQKQYREQLMEAERVRNSLRDRDIELHQLRDGAALGTLEAGKWAKERDTYEDRIGVLEGDLVAAAAAHASLEDQKQENMMLKETIDRLKYEMDELRMAAAGTAKEGEVG